MGRMTPGKVAALMVPGVGLAVATVELCRSLGETIGQTTHRTGPLG
jgi:hypothetical protein